jgi:energy-coupling factor transporter transmembrane protein EcfT
MVAKLLFTSTILNSVSLALGYGLVGLWAGAVFVMVLGFLWLIGQRRGWNWMASVMLMLFVGAASIGIWLDAPDGWMLLGAVAALSAWDLDHFTKRLSGVGQNRVEETRDLERCHLERLLVVDGLSLLFGAVALGIEVDLGFGTALLLGLLAILGLSRVIGILRRESD